MKFLIFSPILLSFVHSWNYRHTLQIQTVLQTHSTLDSDYLDHEITVVAVNKFYLAKALIFPSILPSFVHSWNYGHTLQIQSHVVGITNRRKWCQGFEYIPVHISISSVVEFQRWWVLKCKIIFAKNQHTQMKILYFVNIKNLS